MRVMVNLLSSSAGGGLAYVRNLIPLLVRLFNESREHSLVLLLHPYHRTDLLGAVANDVECVEVAQQPNPYARVLWEMRAIPRIVAERKIDVLFTPYQLAPRVRKLKSVAMIRNMEPFLFGKYRYDLKNYVRNTLLKRASNNTLRKADRIIAVSEFAASYCLDTLHIRDDKVITIHHGRDQRFKPEAGADDAAILAGLGVGPVYIFTCGSMLPYRRCELIIEAFNRWAQGKDCQLVIAGSSTDQNYQSRIRALIERSPDPAKIKWLGQVKIEAMPVLYRHSQFFVTATEIEACPNIGIEALSSGCHIVSSSNDPLPEIFADAALFYDAGNTGELIGKLDLLFSSARSTNQKALARAEHFSWEACAGHTFKALTEW